MKFTILLQILFDLLAKRRIPAKDLAAKYEISTRTVYRYVDCLAFSVPVYVQRGRGGGICLSDNYKLPMGFMTKDEYESAIEALSIAYAHSPQPRFLQVKRKLSAEYKSERRNEEFLGSDDMFLMDGSVFGESRGLYETLCLFRRAIGQHAIVEIEYFTRYDGRLTERVEPHLLAFKRNVWYVYAFCRSTRKFSLLHLGRVLSAGKTEEHFTPRPFQREDVPLQFWTGDKPYITVCLQVDNKALFRLQEQAGVDAIERVDGTWQAHVTFPKDEHLIPTLVALGDGVKILQPKSLQTEALQFINRTRHVYEK